MPTLTTLRPYLYTYTLFSHFALYFSLIYTLSLTFYSLSLLNTHSFLQCNSLSHTHTHYILSNSSLSARDLLLQSLSFRNTLSHILLPPSLPLSLSLSYRHIVSNIATLSYLDKTLSLSLHSLLPPFSHSHSLTLNSFSNSLSYRYTQSHNA